jgi:chromosome segregation ATPase
MEHLERVLDKLDRIDERLAKQGESLARLEERFAAHESKLEEHEAEDEKMRHKIDELYKFKWTVLGIAGVVSFAFSYVVDWMRGSQ